MSKEKNTDNKGIGLKEILCKKDYQELKDQISRRDFLKLGHKFILASGISLFFFKLSFPQANSRLKDKKDKKDKNGKHYDDSDHLWVYIIDPKKCIGCGKCVKSCKFENSVPDDYYRTWVERYSYTSHDKTYIDSPKGALNGFNKTKSNLKFIKSFFVPKICNQCENSVCEQVCPVGATYTTPDGVVLVDYKHCIGCGYCIQACPYGCRFKNPITHTADKCTLCYHRIVKGLKTACIIACPRGVRTLVDIKNRDDGQLFNYYATSTLNVLKPELGTRPKVYYTVLDKEIH